jgi:1-deoxy-D-xylulose-5-phosphate reductoisomerase
VRSVVILGSTGSIGVQALDVIRRNPNDFRVLALAAAGSDPKLLAQQALEFAVQVVAVADARAASDLQLALYAQAQKMGFAEGQMELPRIEAGPTAAVTVAGMPCDVVLNGMSGAAGLEPTLAALSAGSTLALANKESLIIGGPLVSAIARPNQIVPVDSEHSAIAQCLLGSEMPAVRRLVLTASGGPFRGMSRAELATVTVEQALAHPTWDMGPLVTINSATLMNKGLEVIEAHLLFGVSLSAIDVVVHPQSVVHSMVEFIDGSTLAQASPPDMRLPIALGLAWPERLPNVAPGCDWTQAATWEFFPLDVEVFPAITLARMAGERGGTAPAVLNAADEVAVAEFLTGQLSFLGIVDTVRAVLRDHLSEQDGPDGASWIPGNEATLATVQAADAWARVRAAEYIAGG